VRATSEQTRSTAWRACALALALAVIPAAAAKAQSGGAPAPGSVPPATPAPAPAASGQVFPVPGPHTFGDGFGAGRNHQGADIFAACGSAEVAVAKGRVVNAGFQASAGNYLVIRAKKLRKDFIYMHLEAPTPLGRKQKVVPGQLVGAVGETGNASGCHLHFEIWKGKWYRGGRAVDPMPSLMRWDAFS
jgi:murein DD-endopeptidase MepM/ murein hydrolase activator NlpD